MNDYALVRFWCFIREREAIRVAKERGDPWPWSNNYIMNTNHFCNVRREDDRGTKEIRAVVLAHKELTTSDLPWVYTMARLFNKATTLDYVLSCIEEGSVHGWVDNLKLRMSNGDKLFNTAYVVSTNGRRMSKLDYVYEMVESVKLLTLTPFDDCQEVFEELMTIRGLGSFLAGQIVADLKNDRYLEHASDRFWFSCIGPGSKKGLNYLFGPGTSEKNYQERMRALVADMPNDIVKMRLHMQDLQNCLCEFSKYMALCEGTRKRSRPYHK